MARSSRRSGRARRAERGGIGSLGQAVQQFLNESGLGAKMRDWPVYEAWSKALGEDLARRARPVDFKHGQLFVEVESAAHLSELRGFTGERYRALANRHLGAERIRRVSFKLKT